MLILSFVQQNIKELSKLKLQLRSKHSKHSKNLKDLLKYF